MKKIFGIASLIIALILGTCLSSQAQIVMVQPMQIDGGFGMLHSLNVENQQNTAREYEDSSVHDKSNIELKHVQSPGLKSGNEYYIIEYEVKYSICTYNKNRQTDLQSGSYYHKLVGCKFKNESASKDLN